RLAKPIVANAGNDQWICDDNTQLAGNDDPTAIGQWTLVPGFATGTFTNASLYNTTITGLTDGTHRLAWTLTKGVCPASSDTVEIKVQPRTSTVFAGNDQTVCVDTVILNATALTQGIGHWETNGGAGFVDIFDRNTKVTNLSIGDNTFTWVAENGPCVDETDEVVITRLAKPIVANAGNDQWICDDNTQLAGNDDPTAIGQWTLVPGFATGTFTNASLYNTTITGLTDGTHRLAWTLTKGVCPASSDTVEIKVQPRTSNVFAGNDQAVCADTVILNATALTQGIGHWETNGGAGFVDIYNRNTKVTNLSIGDNTFTWVAENGPCVDETDEVVITRLAKPIVANAGNDQWICDDNTLFEGSNDLNVVGVWTLVPGEATGVITSPNTYNSAVTGIPDGTHRFAWTVSNGVCPATTDTVEIKVHPRTSLIYAGDDQTICVDTANLNATLLTQGTGHWETTGGAGIENINDINTKVTNLTFGDNIFTWVVENEPCVDESDEVIITRTLIPLKANAGDNQWICDDNTQLEGNNDPWATGVWSLVPGFATGVFDDENVYNTNITGLTDGVHRLAWTVSNGVCPSTTDTVEITVNPRTSTVFAGNDQRLCTDTTTLLALQVAQGIGYWEGVSTTATFDEINNDTTIVRNLAFGENTLVWVVENSPCPIETDTVIIIRDQPVGTANAGDDIKTCDISAVLAAEEVFVGVGHWEVLQGGSNVNNPLTYNSLVSGLSRIQPNILIWKVENETCAPNVDTLIIDVYKIPSTATVGNDVTICDTEFVLDGNQPTIGNGFWETISGTGVFVDSTDAKTTITGLAIGDNIISWNIYNGSCDTSSAFITITRDENPSDPVVEDDFSVCDTIAQINTIQPLVGNGIWVSFSSGRTIDDNLALTTQVGNLQYGSNRFAWIVQNGVCPLKTAILDVTRNEPPSDAIAGNNDTICSTSYVLNANTPAVGTGLWEVTSGTGTFDDVNDPKTTVNGLAPGANVLRWSIISGVCDTTISAVVITRIEEPSDPIVQDDFNVCDTIAEINAIAPEVGTGIWVTLDSGRTIENNTAPITNVGGLEYGSNYFYWITSNGICPVKSAVLDVFRNLPADTANAGIDIEVCGFETQLNAQPLALGQGTWTDQAGIAIFDDENNPTANVSNLSLDQNMLFWTSSNGVCIGNKDTLIITALPIPIIELSDELFLCDEYETNVSADELTSFETGIWRVLSGTSSIDNVNNHNINVTTLNVGENLLEWSVTNTIGCTGKDTINIRVDEKPSAAYMDPIADVCEDSLVAIEATQPLLGNGKWTSIDGAVTFKNDSTFSTIASLTSYGNQSIQWAVSNGVCPPSDTTISFVRYQNPSTPEISESDTICDNETTLTALNPIVGQGVWKLVSGAAVIEDSLSMSTLVENMSDGLNTFSYTISNGVCLAKTAELTILKLPALSKPIILSVGDICDDNFVLEASQPQVGEIGTWEVLFGAVIIDDVNMATTTANGVVPEDVTLKWTISNEVCESTVEKTISFYGTTPQAYAGADLVVCESLINLNALSPLKGSGTWDIIQGEGLSADWSLDTTEISALELGTTKLTWTVLLGTCPVTLDTMEISYELGPEIILPEMYVTQPGIAVSLVAKVIDAIDITWSPPGGLTNLKTPVTTATVYESTSFTITAVDENGCSASNTTTVETSNLSTNTIVQVNLFSPNGDGVNDYWTINKQSIATGCAVQIYDRYGVVVFSSSNYANEWDGTKDGQQLPEGTYYYSISCENNQSEQGAITLLR
ncbi:MAG: gliding motility-associated-like protein, partial [Flavobacteriales bacterium]